MSGRPASEAGAAGAAPEAVEDFLSLAAHPPSCLSAEVVVVGSGPGGAVAAACLAEGGRETLLLEEGPCVPLSACAAFSHEEMARKYRHGGIAVALGPERVAYAEARCVGGGSEVNAGLYHRAPAEVLEAWRRSSGVEGLGAGDLEPHFEACERDLGVSLFPGPASALSRRLEVGAERLGWRSLEAPRLRLFPEDGCLAEDGPPDRSLPLRGLLRGLHRGERRSMSRTYLPRFLQAGGRLLADTRVTSLRRRAGGFEIRALRQTATSERGVERRELRIRARAVFLACGAIQTPALLQRSGLGQRAGLGLRLHATVKAVARFHEEVNEAQAEVGARQVREFAPRFTLGCSVSSPPHLALALLDHPAALEEVDAGWRRMGVYHAMVSGGQGRVRTLPCFRDPLVSYRLPGESLLDLGDGLRALCRALLEAGAEEVHPAVAGVPPVRSESDLERLPARLPPGRARLMTVHLMASCPMGEDRRAASCDSLGRVHGVEGLSIACASAFPGALGVNPQGTVMALARRAALAYLGRL